MARKKTDEDEKPAKDTANPNEENEDGTPKWVAEALKADIARREKYKSKAQKEREARNSDDYYLPDRDGDASEDREENKDDNEDTQGGGMRDKNPSRDNSYGDAYGASPVPHFSDSDSRVFLKKRVGSIEEEINNSIMNCNDIQRALTPVLRRGTDVLKNHHLLVNKYGEDAVINEMKAQIADMASVMAVAIGSIKNIKFAQGRAQEMVDDVKQEFLSMDDKYGGDEYEYEDDDDFGQ